MGWMCTHVSTQPNSVHIALNQVHGPSRGQPGLDTLIMWSWGHRKMKNPSFMKTSDNPHLGVTHWFSNFQDTGLRWVLMSLVTQSWTISSTRLVWGASSVLEIWWKGSQRWTWSNWKVTVCTQLTWKGNYHHIQTKITVILIKKSFKYLFVQLSRTSKLSKLKWRKIKLHVEPQ